jgi:isoquinoline 1-oxidoreductase subunit beta
VDERQPFPVRHLSAHSERDPRRRDDPCERGPPGSSHRAAAPEPPALTDEEAADPVHPYIRIGDDGIIVVFSSQIEMGQGIHTGLATIVAEELDADFDSIRVVNAQSLREEEFKRGRFRAMAVHRVRAAADAAGRLTAVRHAIAAQPTSPNLPFVRDIMFTNGVDLFTTTGVADHPYTVPAFKLESTNVETGVPTMVWRSVGNSHTEFAHECALGELALAAGRDPVDFRRGVLADNPRTLRALELAAQVVGSDKPPPDGHARGVACSGFLSHSAQIAEVTLDDRGRIHVDRVVFALDCGIAINPDLIRAQVEGGVVFGLSAAAWGEIVLGDGGDIVIQSFDRYPIERMQSAPDVEVHLIDSDEPPSGVGEVSVPTTAPALANAIAALIGNRIRRLPLNKSIRIY